MANKIKDFKNLHKDQRVFLIGNGPSLNKTPLDKFKNEHSIAMNRISLIYKKTSWRPTYFICTTNNIKNKHWRKDILHSIDIGITSFVWEKLRPFVGKRKNVHYIECTNGSEITDRPKKSWWSNDIEKRVTKFGTSMMVALQIANYMGFNPMYLLGSDLGFKDNKKSKLRDKASKFIPYLNNDKNHFVSHYGTPGFDAKTLNKNMLAAHKLAKKSLRHNNKKIYNATLGGELELYPRKNIYDLVK